jgi:eukaryotic-like serine/threonine-protein kinase
MKSALEFDARVAVARRLPFAPLVDRYSIVGKLRSAGRAEVSIGLPLAARSSDELVVIKAYASRGEEVGAIDPGVEIPPEVDVASTPRHDNLARVFECGWEAGRHFIVSEYLEGTTLRRLLIWLAAREEKLPDAAVSRILLGLFAAVEHANHWARTPQARALVHQPVDATDVFITYAGEVKVLGFKPPRARDAAAPGECAAGEPAAVDELLSTQRSPALGAALARIGNRVSANSLIGLWQVARMLKDWQSHELHSNGLTELAEVMARVQPEGRAARRKRLDVAVARVVRARDEAEPIDGAPVSGYRVAGASDAIIIGPRPRLREADAGEPVPIARSAEAISHLQRVRLLPPPLAAGLAPQRPLPRAQPLPPALTTQPPAAPSALTAPSPSALAADWPSTLAAQLLPLVPPRASARAARRRSMPWASLVVLAAGLTAALLVARHRGERVEPTAQAPAGPAPARLALPAEPSVEPASSAIASASPAASESSPARGRDTPRPKPAGAPARTAAPPGADPTPGPASRSSSREARAGSASIARALAPASAPGFLTLDTTPWSAVSTGGAPLGQTPLVKVELPPGQHLLELSNEELGIATSILVEIASGVTTVRRIGLERPIHAARQ